MNRSSAGRPVRKRDLYNGDITALGRIRTAVLMDTRIVYSKKKEILDTIDELVNLFVEANEILSVRKIA